LAAHFSHTTRWHDPRWSDGRLARPASPKTRAGTPVLHRNLDNNTPIQWSKTANFAAFVDGDSYRGRENPDTS